MNSPANFDVAVIGGGFTGLSAAYELAKAGRSVVVLERDEQPGGLAGSFDVAGVPLERFYHHWFNNDAAVMDLVAELGVKDKVLLRSTATGIYRANRIFRLSSPLDLLRFTPLSLPGRIQLGLLALRARRVRDWRELEDMTAAQWLRRLGGEEAYRVVWEPLLKGKFGPYADDIGAVWMWNKLKLRGGSRSAEGREQLAYFRGGFAALAAELAAQTCRLGGSLRLNTPALGVETVAGRVTGVRTASGVVRARSVLVTTPLPLAADLLAGAVSEQYSASLRRIEYLGNVCLVLLLKRSLSSTYWLNVSDPSFPYVGVIEHTNFEPPSTYSGTHVVYLSKYLPVTEALYSMSADEALAFSIPHLKRMFPSFEPAWVAGHYLWKERYSQPIVCRNYSRLIPPLQTPLANVFLASMAQIILKTAAPTTPSARGVPPASPWTKRWRRI